MKAPNFQVAIMYFRTPERMKKPVFPSALLPFFKSGLWIEVIKLSDRQNIYRINGIHGDYTVKPSTASLANSQQILELGKLII
ncbi:hypothetical protein [Scytonema sp. PRP1]|uniref:hypothetical protein n=1 Tax=Scytonema sp. PRP1 TaxID=3120513 RepID=UPI002FD30D58